MKNNAIRMFLAVGAACVCGSALDAQTSNEMLSAKIPFAFQVADQTFAPGQYLLREHGYLHTASMQNVVTGQTVFIAGNPAFDRAISPKLVFRCYAGHGCFLAEIRPPHGDGSRVAVTKAEKAILKDEGARDVAMISVDLRHAD